MKWNHRVVRTASGVNSGGTIYTYEFAEVYYDSEGKPSAYGQPFMYGESIAELKELAKRLTSALSEPVVDGDLLEDTDRCEYSEGDA